MSDFRIYSLDDTNNVLGYESYIVTDKGGKTSLASARKFNIDVLSNNYEFLDYINNYKNDFDFYFNKLSSYSSDFFNINNDNNLNIIFDKNGVEYIPSGRYYTLSSNSQDSNYGQYFYIYNDINRLDVTYNIEPNIYSKEYIDYFISTCNFELYGGYNIEINQDDNNYIIKNSALYNNSSNKIFNPFNDNIIARYRSNNNFDLKPRMSRARAYSNNFTISNVDDINANTFCINKKDFNTIFSNALDESILIIGEGSEKFNTSMLATVLIDDYSNVNKEAKALNFIISSGINFAKHEYTSEIYIGDDDIYNFNISELYENYRFIHTKSNEDSVYTYGIYIDNDKIYVGSINDKIHDEYYVRKDHKISFGGYCPEYAGVYKFVICGEDYVDDYFFVVLSEGVFYRGTNLTKNKDDRYITSSYWDLVLNKDNLNHDVLYTY